MGDRGERGVTHLQTIMPRKLSFTNSLFALLNIGVNNETQHLHFTVTVLKDISSHSRYAVGN